LWYNLKEKNKTNMKSINIKKKVLSSMFLGILMYVGMGSLVVYAAEQKEIEATRTSILPATTEGVNCEDVLTGNNDEPKPKDALDVSISKRNNVLGCAIKEGKVKLYMIPYFIQAILEFIIGISGIVSVAAIVYGGYFYLFAGVSEDKDTGKKAIQNGLIGMVISLMAWTVVNIVISLLTM